MHSQVIFLALNQVLAQVQEVEEQIYVAKLLFGHFLMELAIVSLSQLRCVS